MKLVLIGEGEKMNGDNSLEWSYDYECDALFIYWVDEYQY